MSQPVAGIDMVGVETVHNCWSCRYSGVDRDTCHKLSPEGDAAASGIVAWLDSIGFSIAGVPLHADGCPGWAALEVEHAV